MKTMQMGSLLSGVVFAMALLASSSWAVTNTPPTPVIVSAAMRPGTTLMDVTYRVDDPDDAVVSAYPLAFVDGVRSFANVIRPVTFEEGTGANFGTNVAANINHTLVWNGAADWDIDLGQIKFEIICKDSRGLLPFEWLTIPATTNTEEIIISKNAPTDAEALDVLFWLLADGDGVTLTNGSLVATEGDLQNVYLASGTAANQWGIAYIIERMNLQPASSADILLEHFTIEMP